MIRLDSGDAFLSFAGRKDGGESIAVDARNGGNVPAEEVRFGGGEAGRVMGADCDLVVSSLSLSPEFRLSYEGGAVRACGANMVEGAEGDGGLTMGASALPTGGSLPGEAGGRCTTAAVAMSAWRTDCKR